MGDVHELWNEDEDSVLAVRRWASELVVLRSSYNFSCI